MAPMKLIFGPHGPNMQGYLEYHSTWVRTKSQLKNTKPSMYRIMMLEHRTANWNPPKDWFKPGEKVMVYWQDGYGPLGGAQLSGMSTVPMFGSDIVILNHFDLVHISPTEIRNQQYKYYYKNDDPQALHDLLEAWTKTNPLVHVGNKMHSPMDLLKAQGTYQWTYDFDGTKY